MRIYVTEITNLIRNPANVLNFPQITCHFLQRPRSTTPSTFALGYRWWQLSGNETPAGEDWWYVPQIALHCSGQRACSWAKFLKAQYQGLGIALRGEMWDIVSPCHRWHGLRPCTLPHCTEHAYHVFADLSYSLAEHSYRLRSLFAVALPSIKRSFQRYTVSYYSTGTLINNVLAVVEWTTLCLILQLYFDWFECFNAFGKQPREI
jgi:hypothetical protein